MPETSTTLPASAELAQRDFTPQQWLQYYKNIWTRNAVARTIDVKVDEAIKAVNPEEPVDSDTERGQVITVKERLEHRKILVQDALDLCEAIEKLMQIAPEEFVKSTWSKEALAVATDMIPETPAEGINEEQPVPTPEEAPKEPEAEPAPETPAEASTQ